MIAPSSSRAGGFVAWTSAGTFPLLLSIAPTRVGAGVTAVAVGYELAAGTLGGGGFPAVTGPVGVG